MYLNVIAKTQAALNAWYAIVRLLAVPDSNVTAIAEQIAPIYLPTYVSVTLCNITPRNQSNIIAGTSGQWTTLCEVGAGTNVQLIDSRIEPISNESALCWVTLQLTPPAGSDLDPWAWTEPFGFRINKTVDNGLGGGWEFGIGDQEFQALAARFPGFGR